MNTPENNETMRTALGCCADATDELLVHAFFREPTREGASAVAAILNERGYNVTTEELIEQA